LRELEMEWKDILRAYALDIKISFQKKVIGSEV
jgi:hypothetical protein